MFRTKFYKLSQNEIFVFGNAARASQVYPHVYSLSSVTLDQTRPNLGARKVP